MTNFALPDLRGRFPVHPGSLDGRGFVLGERGGQETHTLSLVEIPVHQHTLTLDASFPTTLSFGLLTLDGSRTIRPTTPTFAVDLGGFLPAGSSPVSLNVPLPVPVEMMQCVSGTVTLNPDQSIAGTSPPVSSSGVAFVTSSNKRAVNPTISVTGARIFRLAGEDVLQVFQNDCINTENNFANFLTIRGTATWTVITTTTSLTETSTSVTETSGESSTTAPSTTTASSSSPSCSLFAGHETLFQLTNVVSLSLRSGERKVFRFSGLFCCNNASAATCCFLSSFFPGSSLSQAEASDVFASLSPGGFPQSSLPFDPVFGCGGAQEVLVNTGAVTLGGSVLRWSGATETVEIRSCVNDNNCLWTLQSSLVVKRATGSTTGTFSFLSNSGTE